MHSTLPYNLNVAFDSSGEALLETVYIARQPKAYKTFRPPAYEAAAGSEL